MYTGNRYVLEDKERQHSLPSGASQRVATINSSNY